MAALTENTPRCNTVNSVIKAAEFPTFSKRAQCLNFLIESDYRLREFSLKWLHLKWPDFVYEGDRNQVKSIASRFQAVDLEQFLYHRQQGSSVLIIYVI